MQPYLQDPKTGDKSVTLTAFVVGFLVTTGKLLLSGITIGAITLSQFGGGDYAACMGALGAVYVMRRSMGDKEKPE